MQMRYGISRLPAPQNQSPYPKGQERRTYVPFYENAKIAQMWTRTKKKEEDIIPLY
ncbi:hypothetical protein [Bacillus sp. CECT 9360]|uniref:hypothetical protein n=1 Tax=Bacillus sp. CECT 9360 TaxID=2845821 RepID=UPI0033A815AF